MFSLHAYCLHHLAVITNPEERKVLGVICFHTRELGLGNHGVGNKWTLTPAHSIIRLCSSKICKWHNVILDFMFDVEYFCTVGSSNTLCCCLCASNHRRMFLPRHNRRHPLKFPVSLFLTYAWCIVQWVECIFVNPIPATPIVLEIGPWNKFVLLLFCWLDTLLWSLTMARGLSPQGPGQRMFMPFLVYCIVSSFNCMTCLSCPPALHDILHTPMARYSLFVLKLLLNTNQLTN